MYKQIKAFNHITMMLKQEIISRTWKHFFYCSNRGVFGEGHNFQYNVFLSKNKDALWSIPKTCDTWKKKHLKMKFFSNFLKDFSFFHQRIALKYLQKMLFIWSKNLFLFSRYSNLCISVFPFFPLSPIMSSIV